MKAAASINTRERQEDLGQFLTAAPVAGFMASLFGPLPETVRLLDAGAGAGALTAAFVARCCEKRDGVRAIEATLYELDGEILGALAATFAPGGVVLYIGDTEDKSVHLEAAELAALGVTLDSATKIPDVIVHHRAKNWLLLIEAVTSAGPVDGKRRRELKDLFAGCKAGLVFVTAFENRRTMQAFASQIAWESEVWRADDPDHMIHFNGEKFLGPYPDVTSPSVQSGSK